MVVSIDITGFFLNFMREIVFFLKFSTENRGIRRGCLFLNIYLDSSFGIHMPCKH
jgi:hypothetical protein